VLMTKLLVFGDSHLEALKLAADLNLLRAEDSNFCIVPGATAVGLRNPNSVTNALSEYRYASAIHPLSTHVLIHLGEVDCGFVMWWRRQKYKESIEQQVQDSLSAYRCFVSELKNLGFERICITGASLPTIRDGIDFGDVSNKRSEVKVSLGERTELTRNYNFELRKMASELYCSYFDISDCITDNLSGLVSDFFRNSNSCDHHLDPAKVVGVWAMACNVFLLE
jgi:hypothetical protein